MNRLRVGLTGGLASGKSTLARWLAEDGCHVIDADAIVADLYRAGQPGAEVVERLFGPSFLRQDGSVDREVLGGYIFEHPDDLVRLEEAVHPLVKQLVLQWIHDKSGIAIVEATLLIESGIATDLDVVVTVSADEAVRRQRAIERGLSDEQVDSRLANQGDDSFRETAAHIVLRNNGSIEEFREQAAELLWELRRIHQRRAGSAAQEPLLLVTSNRGKLREAQRLFNGPMISADIDLPEIQSLDIDEVLKAKASTAWGQLKRPLLVEETALELEGLNGFPGPLIKWMLKALGGPGIARLAASTDSKRAKARCRILYRDATQRIAAEGSVTGTLVFPGRGDQGFGWDPVFQPDGSELTFAEMDGAEKDRVSHRGKAWREMERELRSAGVV